MPFKISFSMTWLSWLSYCIIFQMRKGNNELTELQLRFLLFVILFFNQSKSNAVLEPRTGHFRRLVGFEAKAKDLSFKVKDFKMYPRGQGRRRGLHFSLLTKLILWGVRNENLSKVPSSKLLSLQYLLIIPCRGLVFWASRKVFLCVIRPI